MILHSSGYKINTKDKMSTENSILKYLEPEFVYFPIVNENFEYTVVVKVDERVLKGQPLMYREGRYMHPVCSSVSGIVTAIKKMWHSSGKMIDMLEIQNDFKEECYYQTDSSFKINRDYIISKVKNAGIVGLGGGAFPTYIKYLPVQKADCIIINGVECEPYITCDYISMLTWPKKVVDGTRYIMIANSAPKAFIAVKRNHKKAIAALQKELEGINDIKIVPINDAYPMGWERVLVKKIVKKNYVSLPREVNTIVNNVKTAIAVCDAVNDNKPLIENVITISGEGIKNPCNIITKMGTKLSKLIELCGGYTIDDGELHLIVGGPLMGNTIPNDELIITPNVNAVIVLPVVKKSFNYICINCGKCSISCPAFLSPTLIREAFLSKNEKELAILKADTCVGCGLCSYVCPSGINIASFVKSGKKFLLENKKVSTINIRK